ncbi:hypothetical protein BCR33DRAFT_447395 [Rhizoclosmatium globosum]|uniref:Uncharacterized protein n=1 Tax=Rhizoclosmatium globosum TaxID=329046 RepID=A0A1Y2BS56_9FUNG|nr:hypothetical protein BCR33DRAFT_447395 [Rhizoclosmatium globosum]|eukprot:ORY37592.1 hypothetical protein BCR33DRAFT_447395 [Rhizoclosmatium globosum]
MLTNAAPAKTGPRLAGPRPPRPNRYLDEGVGRKTGWRPPKDNDDFDEWLVFEGEGEGEGKVVVVVVVVRMQDQSRFQLLFTTNPLLRNSLLLRV